MANLIVPGASGHGSATLGGFEWVTSIAFVVTAFGTLTRLYGFAPVRRVFQAGWIGLVCTGLGGYPPLVSWAEHIAYESTFRLPLNSFVAFATDVYWELEPGVLCDIEVDW